METRPSVELDTVIGPGGSVHLKDLPYEPGERVRVFVVGSRSGGQRVRSADELRRSEEIRRALKGSILRYDRPTDPACDADEWDVLGGGKQH
jgi:hypothetical protein